MQKQLTLQKILDGYIALKQIAKFPFRNGGVTYTITKNIRATQPLVEDLDKAKEALLAGFEHTINGNLVKFENEEKMAEFQAQYNPLVEKVETVDVWPISQEGLLKYETDITAEQLGALEPFIQEEEKPAPDDLG